MAVRIFFDFGGKEVQAIRYTNPDGSIGGFVSELARIGKGTYVHPLAVVGPYAQIPPNSTIQELAHIGIVPGS